MKKCSILSLIPTVFLLFSITAYSQDCKILYDGIDKTYEGACKKGLAHGKGIAKGEDTYKGNFRKGLPHGKGKYVGAEGSVYEGMWKEGERHGHGTFVDAGGSTYTGSWKEDLRHGTGKFVLKTPEKDSIMEGIWKEDKYMGPKPEKPYVVTFSRSVERQTMRKVGDGNRLSIKIMQGGMANMTVTDYRFQWSSGNEVNLSGNARGWENMDFPFEGRIVYTTANKLRTSSYPVYFEFKINEPGEWELVLHN